MFIDSQDNLEGKAPRLSVTLLPCAWCGGVPKIEYCRGYYSLKSIHIQCQSCGIKTPPYSLTGVCWNESTSSFVSVTEQHAILTITRIWNARKGVKL